METTGTENLGSGAPIDTLAVARYLQDKGVDEKEAEGHAEIYRRLAESLISGHLATKADISKAEASLKADIAKMEGVFKTDIAKMEGIFKTDIAKVEAVFKTDIAEVRRDMDVFRSETKADMEVLRAEVNAKISGLEAKMERGFNSLIKWFVGIVVIQAGLVAALKFLA